MIFDMILEMLCDVAIIPYILYRMTNKKIELTSVVMLGIIYTAIGVIAAIIYPVTTSHFQFEILTLVPFVVEILLFTIFLKSYQKCRFKISLFYTMFILTFTHTVRLFISGFIVSGILRIKSGTIGLAVGALCIVPTLFLLMKWLSINLRQLIISEQLSASRLVGKQEGRTIEQAQDRLLTLANLFMVFFYLYSNLVRLTHFGCHFGFYYFMFIYAFIFVFMIYSINVKYKEWENQKLLKYKDYLFSGLANYADALDKSYQSVRAFRHDFTNILISMRESIQTQEIEEVKKTYDEILGKSNIILEKNRKEVAKLANIKVLELKSVISAKILQAELQGVDVALEIPAAVTELYLDRVDIVRIFGIMLDNAIEAAVETEAEKMTIRVAIFNKDTTRYYIVENEMIDQKLPMDLIFEDGYSTKGRHRGHGLANLASIIANYPKASYHIQAKNYKFRIALEVEKDESIYPRG